MPPSVDAKPNKCSTSAASQRREAIRKTIQRRDECRKTAAKIVEQLLEDNLSQQWFLGACHNLSQQDYQDAVEERSIILQCGYPLCDNKIPRVPSKKYHICSKTNRVFDITERKHYCSDGCYHASVFLRKQLYEGPLWMRDETEAPLKYEILDKEKQRGSHGEEVDFGWRRLKKDEVEILDKSEKSAKYLKAEDSEVSPYMSEEAIQKLATRVEGLEVSEEADASSTRRNLELEHAPSGGKGEPSKREPSNATQPESSRALPEGKSDLLPSSAHPNRQTPSGLHERSDTGTNYNSWMKALKSESKRITPQSPAALLELSPLESAEKTLTNWITIDTLTLLLGKKVVDKMKASNPDFVLSSEAERRAEHFRSLYARICKKLDKEEAEDKQYASKVLDSDDDDDDKKQAVPSSSLPTMEELRRDADLARLKVYGFYKGELEVPVGETDSDDTGGKLDSMPKPKPKKTGKKKLKNKAPDVSPDTKDPILPLVDSHAQNKLRRRILLDRLQKLLPDILDLIDVELAQVSPDLIDLVSTFRLTAQNVVLKTQTCKVVMLCLVLMLNKKNDSLQVALQGERQRSLLGPYLDDIGITLTDAESLTERLLNPEVL